VAEHSKIEWTDASWNPTVGCTKVSEGCRGCYPMRDAHRLAGNPNPKISSVYVGLTRASKNGPQWTGIVRTVPERLAIPLTWRTPRRIFVDSMSDLFHELVPDDFILKVFTVMAQPLVWKEPWSRHTYQVLTKRIDRAADFLSRLRWKFGTRHGGPWRMPETGDRPLNPVATLDGAGDPTPAPHVWIGTSVEDQATAGARIPHLLQAPAAVRFLSCEPLLGPVRLFGDPNADDAGPALVTEGFSFPTDYGTGVEWDAQYSSGIDWVIAGGESGAHARPAHPDWFRNLRDECASLDVPFFFKQWGAWKPISEMPEAEYGALYRPNRMARRHEDQAQLNEIYGLRCTVETRAVQYDGGDGYERIGGYPGYMTFRVGKKDAGRKLDGQTWDELPAAAGAN
jgi:protein gp37